MDTTREDLDLLLTNDHLEKIAGHLKLYSYQVSRELYGDPIKSICEDKEVKWHFSPCLVSTIKFLNYRSINDKIRLTMDDFFANVDLKEEIVGM
jgi:hypothetical protein